MLTAIRRDIQAARERDPARPTVLEVVFAVTVLTWSWRHRGELLSGSEASP